MTLFIHSFSATETKARRVLQDECVTSHHEWGEDGQKWAMISWQISGGLGQKGSKGTSRVGRRKQQAAEGAQGHVGSILPGMRESFRLLRKVKACKRLLRAVHTVSRQLWPSVEGSSHKTGVQLLAPLQQLLILEPKRPKNVPSAPDGTSFT